MQSSDGHVHIELLSRYRMVASKYCFALVYQHRNEEFALSLKMRWKAVQLYLQIVNQRYLSIVKQRQVLEVTSNIEEVLQRHPVETFLQQYRRLLQSSASSKDIWQRQFVEDMPELVKLTLEIAYEYVHISDDYFQESTNTASLQRNLCSRSELYNLIVFTLPQLLTVLLDVVHSSQVNIVQQMQADYQHFQQHQQLTASFHKLCTHLFSSSSEL